MVSSNTDGFAISSGPGISPERFVMLACTVEGAPDFSSIKMALYRCDDVTLGRPNCPLRGPKPARN